LRKPEDAKLAKKRGDATCMRCDKLVKEMQSERDKTVKELELKVKSAMKERDEAKWGEAQANKKQKEALEQIKPLQDEKDRAVKERDEALRRLECFVCLTHDSALHAFIPCGHMVCTACKDAFTVDKPCPNCQVKIMGQLKLFN
jgi:hypothetical protein